MDIPPLEAVKNIPFIILGIWPVNLLTLWAQGHSWGWQQTPPAVLDLWEWGAFVSCSVVILVELGAKMFYARAEHRRKMAKERAAERAAGRAEGRAETRHEMVGMLAMLRAAARKNPELLPELLDEYAAQLQNGSGEKPA